MQRTTLLITFLILVLLLMLAACGAEAVPLPAVLPTLATDAMPDADSPRIPAARQVPPTWTPPSPVIAPTRLTPQPETGDERQATNGATHDEGGETYVVQAGDTLAEIATDFGVDLELLAEVNVIEDIDVIEVGQELFIPSQ